jgi:hypothetical protein
MAHDNRSIGEKLRAMDEHAHAPTGAGEDTPRENAEQAERAPASRENIRGGMSEQGKNRERKHR